MVEVKGCDVEGHSAAQHAEIPHFCIQGIVLSRLLTPGINVIALEQAESRGQQTGILVKDGGKECNHEAPSQLCMFA